MKKKKSIDNSQASRDILIEWAAHVIAYRAVFGIGSDGDVRIGNRSDELVAMKRAISIIRELKTL